VTARFRYRPRTQEQAAHHWRRHEQHDAVRDAYRGNTKPLADLLRAEGLDAVADLIERGTWRKRDARSQVDEMAHEIAAAVRLNEGLVRRNNGGKLPRGTRPRLIQEACAAWAEYGEFDSLSTEAERGSRPPSAPSWTASRCGAPRPRLGLRAASARQRARQGRVRPKAPLPTSRSCNVC
jgi:hypothetical protein